MPLGNVMHDNILIRCEKPFSLAGDVQEAWLDRANNVIWSVEQSPTVPRAGKGERLDLSRLPQLWQKVEGFPPIPVEQIGLAKER
jgi:hypothetical protein